MASRGVDVKEAVPPAIAEYGDLYARMRNGDTVITLARLIEHECGGYRRPSGL